MFFGMPSRIINKSGKAIHGALGFVGGLLKLIRMTNPTHVAVLFDGEHPNARSTLNADYKANRIDYAAVADDENPFTQLPDIYAALDYLGIKHAETTVCETDDWIAGYAFAYGNDMQVVISSFDSDYFQLLGDNVSVIRYRGVKSTVCTPQYLFERFGITPSQYADFKALAGDPSDNIKGAEKVGPKTAAQLLNTFGNLENVLANAQQIKSVSVRSSVVSSAERLRTNYQLIKLSDGAELPFKLAELKYAVPDTSTNAVLKAIALMP